MAFTFLVGVQLARGLGTEGYGVYGMAMSILALLAIPIEFGLPQLLTREVAVAKTKSDWAVLCGVLRWSTCYVAAFSIMTACLVLAWLGISDHGMETEFGRAVLVGLVMVPLVALGKLREAALRGLQYIVRGQLPEAVLRPASFAALFFIGSLMVPEPAPWHAMAVGVVSAGLSFYVAAVMLRWVLDARADRSVVSTKGWEWWRRSLPMATTEGIRVLQPHLLILLLGWMSTAETVGIFRVATSLVLFLAIFETLFDVVAAPVLARLHAEGDHGRMQRTLAWCSAGMFVGSLGLLLPFAIGGESIMRFLFGAEYVQAAPLLLILGAGVVLNAAFGVSAALLNMTGHQKKVTHASAVSLTILGLIAVPAINFLGVTGAAWANVFAMFAWKLFAWIDAKRLLNLDTSLVAFGHVLKGRG